MIKQFQKNKSVFLAVLFPVLAFVILYILVPYDTGYLHEKQPIVYWVYHGYTEIENGEWGFGIVVLPAAVVMLWLTRKQYLNEPIQGSYFGGVLLLLSLLFYLIGFKANQKFVGYLSGHLFIAGCVIWVLGLRMFFKVVWLWIFLGMMWPLTPLIDIISFPLRKVATELTVKIWNFLGYETVQNGTSILSAATEEFARGEKFTLQIAAACSGLRSLFALLMISLIFAYVGVKKNWHRVIVVVSMFPIAVLANVVRISLLLLGTILWGNDFAIGSDASPSSYHLGAGFVVYFISLFLMFGLVSLLNGNWFVFFNKKKIVVHKKAEKL